MKTFLRLPRQVVGVKTSLRRPYCLSKKKERKIWKRSLSENLIEAPLLSFKKKKRKRRKKKEEKTRKTKTTSLSCEIACRLQVFYGGEGASQLKAKGPYHAVRTPHQHLLQEYSFSPRYVQFYYSLSLLQEDADFLQEDADFLQEGADSLQETQPFYRKLCISTGNFL